MKKNFLLVITTILVIACSVTKVQDLPIKSVQEFKIPSPQIWSLPNGIKVYFMQNKELPFVQGALYTKAGNWHEAESEFGILDALGSQMRQGGVGNLNSDNLDIELEKLSAVIATDFSNEFGTFSFGCFNADLDRVFDLFTDMIFKPRFDEARLNLWKKNTLQIISKRKQEPDDIASITFKQIVYSKFPYNRIVSSKDIKGINKKRLIEAHKKFVIPDDAIFAFTGDVTREKIEQLLSKQFANWELSYKTLVLPAAPEKSTLGIYFVKAPFSQSTVFIGQIGPKRDFKKLFDIRVFNDIFSGSIFSARLPKKVRNDLGLAYVVSGRISPDTQFGTNYIYLQTKAESTGQAILASIKVLSDFEKEPVTESENTEVKRGIENSFVFTFEKPESIVTRKITQELQKYPQDFDDNYLKNLKLVSPQSVQSVYKANWYINNLAIIVVGNDQAYQELNNIKSNLPASLKDLEIRTVKFDEIVVAY